MLDRRKFLQLCADLAVGGVLSSSGATVVQPTRDRLGQLLPTRVLGRTGEAVTMLGVGGANLSHMSESEAEVAVEVAIEGGVRFFDTAEAYFEGNSERRLGKLVVPKYRDVVFIMTKTGARDAATARQHLEGSLKRLGTDHLDLWQVHALETAEDVDNRFDGGVIDAVVEAKESGKVRYIGFTGHSRPSAHQRMLERTDLFDACQMPVNLADPHYESFIEGVLPTLVERKIAVLAMKTLAAGGFFGGANFQPSGGNPRIVPDRVSVPEALGFVWSFPVSVLITGANDSAQMKANVESARSFVPLDGPQRAALVDKVADIAGKGVEFFKG